MPVNLTAISIGSTDWGTAVNGYWSTITNAFNGTETIGPLNFQNGGGIYLRLPQLTTSERNALSAVNGMMLYNTSNLRFERYQNSAWGGFSESGANSDITSLSGLTTPLSAAQGGTGINNGTFALTIPATGTAALLGTAQTFSATNTFLKTAAYNSTLAPLKVGDPTSSTKRLELGYDTSLNAGYINGIDTGFEWRPIYFNASAADPAVNAIIIGKSSNDAVGMLQVNGAITATGIKIGSPTTAVSTADNVIGCSGAGQKALVIQAKSSQTAALLQVQDSSGGSIASIDYDGSLYGNIISANGGSLYLSNSGDLLLHRVSAGKVEITDGGSNHYVQLGQLSNFYKGSNVASASTITASGNLFHVTGTTNISSVSGTNIVAGTKITIIFDGSLTVTDGSNLKLAGHFSTSADATLTLIYDGSNWYEISRSVN